MGLDMYLNKTKKMDFPSFRALTELFYNDIEGYDRLKEKAQGLPLKSVVEEYKGVPLYVEGIEEYKYVRAAQEVGYWRKANHIHAWFVDNVQSGEDDCGEYLVTPEDLLKLKSLCEAVIEDRSSTTSAKLLPTQSGFFFGGTDYDEHYYDDCQNTIEIINQVLADFNPDEEMLYYSSSW